MLVDTGSDCTLLSRRAAEKLGLERDVSSCLCRVVTISGVKDLMGEVGLECEPLVEFPLRAEVHVSDTVNEKYDGILGCDLMERVGMECTSRNQWWRVRIEKVTHWVDNLVMPKGRVVVGVINRVSGGEDFDKKLKREFQDVFWVEGTPLSVTGRAKHRIELATDKPVYV